MSVWLNAYLTSHWHQLHLVNNTLCRIAKSRDSCHNLLRCFKIAIACVTIVIKYLVWFHIAHSVTIISTCMKISRHGTSQDAPKLLWQTRSCFCLFSIVCFTVHQVDSSLLMVCMPENLSSSADAFRVKARGLQRQMWWKECRVLSAFIYFNC